MKPTQDQKSNVKAQQTKPNRGGSNKSNRGMRGRQGRKDSKSNRVNFDNTRESKFEKDIERTEKTSKSNDVRWYARNEEMLRSAASVPFSSTTGMDVGFKAHNAVPGVMSIRWNPALAGPGNDPINQAKNSIYSFTVHANSRNQSYDASDEMMLILAGASLFAALAQGIRAYGIAKLYDQRNSYLPDALLTAIGFNPNNIRENLSDIWFDLNELIARSSQIWIPNELPLIERWFWMNSNVYQDSDSVKGQFYVFRPFTFLKLDETDEGGTALQQVAFAPGNTTVSWATYKSMMNELFDALLDSQDRGIIFGDILKAYGADKIYAVQQITSDYTIKPVYDTEVLSQIENLTTFGGAMLGVVQDPNNGVIYPKWQVVNEWSDYYKSDYSDVGKLGINSSVLNMHSDGDPTPAEVMVATRLKAYGSVTYRLPGDNLNERVAPKTSGTEVALSFSIYFYNFAAGKSLNRVTLHSCVARGTVSTDVISLWSAFDWAPWIYEIDPADLPTGEATVDQDITLIPVLPYGDYDNWTKIDGDTLQKMHLTAVYSEFGVPQI